MRTRDLEIRFADHKREFTELLAKADHDKYISTLKVMTNQPDDLHIPPSDWKRYQEIFKTLGIREGMFRGDDASITLVVYGQGGPLAGDSMAYVYSATPLETTQADLDILPDGVAYKKLADNWYILHHVW